jgi:hypothetical protein
LKKPSKTYARQATMPFAPAAVMGRPTNGRRLKSVFLGDWHILAMNDLLWQRKMKWNDWLEQIIMQEIEVAVETGELSRPNKS